MKVVEISNGLKLFRRNKYFQHKEITLVSQSYSSLVMQFNLKGTNQYTNFLNDEFNESTEKYAIINLLNEFDGMVSVPENTHRQVVTLILEKQFLLKSLPQQKQSDEILNFFETKKTFQKIYSDKMKFKTQALAYDILNSPYKNNLDKLYVESKALELIHNEITILLTEQNSIPFMKFSNRDKEAIHYAAHMLVQDLDNPPDIMEIARSVGLSRTKLFSCFRQTFGLSPFEYLRNHRLQMARQLLQDGEVNVTQAALMVGYTNLSHFAKAFKSIFGIAPSELRRSIRIT